MLTPVVCCEIVSMKNNSLSQSFRSLSADLNIGLTALIQLVMATCPLESFTYANLRSSKKVSSTALRPSSGVYVSKVSVSSLELVFERRTTDFELCFDRLDSVLFLESRVRDRQKGFLKLQRCWSESVTDAVSIVAHQNPNFLFRQLRFHFLQNG